MAAQTAVADTTEEGAFKRQPAVFRDRITQDGQYRPEGALTRVVTHTAAALTHLTAGRYVLYVSYACPWANRALAVLRLKGLESVVDVAVTHPVWARTRPEDPNDTHAGWQFKQESDAPVANPTGCVRRRARGVPSRCHPRRRLAYGVTRAHVASKHKTSPAALTTRALASQVWQLSLRRLRA